MGSDRAVWYDINFSLPSAAKRKVAVFNSSGAQYRWDYTIFIDHLKRTFGNRQEKENKQELLATIKQKDTQRFFDYFPKFDEILSGAGGEHWTEDSKVFWLRRSLSEPLKEQLIQTQLDYHDYYSTARKIEEVADRFEHTSLFKGKRTQSGAANIPMSGTIAPPSNQLDADGDVIMNHMNGRPQRNDNGKRRDRLQNSQKRATKNENSNTTVKKHARLIDDSKLDRRREIGFCLRCGTKLIRCFAAHISHLSGQW
ncbi:putative eka-like protein [Golovinomyces cichoracearum]|uniref:Putative eka-like protein n=1 Tax=Golovinomyces cichoracearum TaxID=62708 RepID=A0A420IY73_9PEZI|nr:putative eka-like protein [Golovinomyces cichoracearum]